MSAFFAAWALLAAAFSAVTVVRVWRRPVAKSLDGERPPVLLLRPVDAPSPRELQSLAAPIAYAGSLRQVVLSPTRPALDAEWVESDPSVPNRKVGHLLRGLDVVTREPSTVVLAVDADVEVDGALVDSLVRAVQSGAAVASAAPEPSVSSSLVGAAVRGLLVQSHHSFRALDAMSAGAKAVCGKALAFGPQAVDELRRLDQCIGEDLELSQRLHARGLTVALAEVPARVPQAEQPSLQAAHARFTRWMQVLRAHRPGLFPTVPLLFTATPLLLMASLFSQWVALATLPVVLVRCLLAARLDARGGLRVEWLLGEWLLLACWVSSIRLGSTVTWRGRSWQLGEGGVMR